MKTLHRTWLVVLIGVSSALNAQQLQQPLEEVPMSNKGYVLLKNGEVISGKIQNTTSTRGITQVTLIDDTGEKHKIKSTEISEFLIAMNEAVKFQFANERGSSVKKLLTKKQPSAVPSDYIIYRNVIPKGEKELLLQLLNPDFDEIFEIYYDPQARKTTALEGEFISWTGDMHRVFLVKKLNSSPLLVKKGSYKKTFPELFGDCDMLMQLTKPDFKDIEAHIQLYMKACTQAEGAL